MGKVPEMLDWSQTQMGTNSSASISCLIYTVYTQRVSHRLKIYCKRCRLPGSVYEYSSISLPFCSVKVAALPNDEQRHHSQMLVTTKKNEPDHFEPGKTFPFSIIPDCPFCICSCNDWFQIATPPSLTFLATRYLPFIFQAITSYFTMRRYPPMAGHLEVNAQLHFKYIHVPPRWQTTLVGEVAHVIKSTQVRL